MGLVHIYCGDGKGKTCSAIGLAVRAAGRGIPVVIARFLKTDNSGEVIALGNIPGITLIACTKEFGFVSAMDAETKKKAAEYNRELFAEAAGKVSGLYAVEEELKPGNDVRAVLILDELITAVSLGMIPEDDVVKFIERRSSGIEVVLTGRDPSQRLIGMADYVSRIEAVKHPYERGITARKGIEY